MIKNKRDFLINIVAFLTIILFAYIIESKLIHPSEENKRESISNIISCEQQEGEYSGWFKCNSNESYDVDNILVTQLETNAKNIVIVETGGNLYGALYGSSTMPFDKRDVLVGNNEHSFGEAVIRVNDNLVNYDIYVESTSMEGIEFENLVFSKFNVGIVVLISAIGISTFLLVRYSKYFTNNIEAAFLLLSILFGISGAVLTPIFHAFDEMAHFVKAYDDNLLLVFDKKFPADMGMVINGVYANSYFELSTIYDAVSGQPLVSEIVYSAEQYIPMAYGAYFVGLSVSSFVTTNIYTIYVFGKISGVIVYSLLGYILIKRSKYLKRSMFILLLVPSVFIVNISYSLDYPTIIAILFIFTTILNIRSNKSVSRTDIIILSVASVFTIFSKLPYVLVTPIILLIYKYVDRKEFRKTIAIYSVSIIVALLLTVIYVSSKGASYFEGINSDISVSEQMKYVITNPLNFMKLTIDPIKQIITQYPGDLLNLHFISGEPIIAYGSLSLVGFGVVIPMLLFSVFYDVQSLKLTVKERLYMLSICIIATYGVFGTLYLTFTPVGEEVINGYQVRYFTPLIIIALTALMPLNNNLILKNRLTLVELAQKSALVVIFLICYKYFLELELYFTLFVGLMVLTIIFLKFIKNFRYNEKYYIEILIIMYIVLLGIQVYFLQYNI